jgi:hypothetical protein
VHTTEPLAPFPELIVQTWMFALQVAVVPPLAPVHVQFHGPVPVTVVGVPKVQRFIVGRDAKFALLLLPQTPLTGTTTVVKLQVLAVKELFDRSLMALVSETEYVLP